MRRVDLGLAMQTLTPKQWHVILLHGMMRHSQDTVAEALMIQQQSVSERFDNGIKRITDYLNGDNH